MLGKNKESEGRKKGIVTQKLEEDSLHIGRDRSKNPLTNTPELVSGRKGRKQERTEFGTEKLGINKEGQG